MSRKFREYNGVPFGSAYVIPHDVTIAVVCRQCGHASEMTRDELKRRNILYLYFREYEHRLVCGQCGARGAKVTTGDFRD